MLTTEEQLELLDKLSAALRDCYIKGVPIDRIKDVLENCAAIRTRELVGPTKKNTAKRAAK